MIPLAVAEAPAVRCSSCRFAWHSHTMADGLRILGRCPRCDGMLVFRDELGEGPHPGDDPVVAAVAPHLVLGPARPAPRGG